MEEMIKQAIEALQKSSCNEIELTDSTGLKVKVVKFSPIPQYNSTWPYEYTAQYPFKPY